MLNSWNVVRRLVADGILKMSFKCCLLAVLLMRNHAEFALLDTVHAERVLYFYQVTMCACVTHNLATDSLIMQTRNSRMLVPMKQAWPDHPDTLLTLCAAWAM